MISAHLDGVITGRELGPEFYLDGETADEEGLVLVRVKPLPIGNNLYYDRRGTLHAIDRVGMATEDWLYLLGVWFITISGGLAIGYAIGQRDEWEPVAWTVIAVLAAAGLGWMLRHLLRR